MERRLRCRDRCRGAIEIPLCLSLSDAAQEDLRAIWRHSALEWGEARADAYLNDLDAAFDLLRRLPRVGTARTHRGRHYRKWACGSHAIYYRVDGESLRVVRVLHSRMDVRQQLP